MKQGRYLVIFIVQLVGSQFCRAQDFVIHGEFLKDSTLVGQELRYSLSARYPENATILFPDSTASFRPFDFIKKEYVPTKTINNTSYDSVVYTLMTFEVDSLQSLSLPVYVVHESDCTLYSSKADTVLVSSVLTDLPDTLSLRTLPLKETISFEPISTQFNYSNAAIIVGILLVLSFSGWLVFGKKIKRHFTIRRLLQNHLRFVQDYNGNLEKISNSVSPLIAESTISVWKKYMEKLESTPFTKLTTRETMRLLNDNSLNQHLQSIDRAIYGKHAINNKPFEELKVFAEDKFQKKLQEVKNG